MSKNHKNTLNPKPKGRPSRHWVDGLRARIWYEAVKRRTGLSDYELDSRFASYPDEYGVTKRPTDVFARIRRLGNLPSRGSHPRASHDLVAGVNERVQGSQAIYEAVFWDLLKNPPSLTNTHEQLQICLFEMHMQRVPWSVAERMFAAFAASKVDERSGYSVCLKAALKPLGILDQMRLLALLTREADLSNNAQATELTRGFFDESLEGFLCGILGTEDGLDAYHLAIEEYLFGSRSVMPAEIDLRERLQFDSSFLIVPIDFSSTQQT